MRLRLPHLGLRLLFFCLVIGVMGFSEESCEEIFTYLYDNGEWGYNEDGSSSSGYGSLKENALPYMKYLVNFINKYKIKSVVDVGCGDWEFSKHIHWGKVRYIGIDCVKSVIERDQALYQTPTVTFIHGDILTMDLPNAELLLCKDVLQHLFNQDIIQLLKKFKKYRYCLITNDFKVGLPFNEDIPKRGPHRPLDLSKMPFNVRGSSVLIYPVLDDLKQIFYIRN